MCHNGFFIEIPSVQFVTSFQLEEPNVLASGNFSLVYKFEYNLVSNFNAFAK